MPKKKVTEEDEPEHHEPEEASPFEQVEEGEEVEPEEEPEDEIEVIPLIELFESNTNKWSFSIDLIKADPDDPETENVVSAMFDNVTIEIPLPDFIELGANISVILPKLIEIHNAGKGGD